MDKIVFLIKTAEFGSINIIFTINKFVNCLMLYYNYYNIVIYLYLMNFLFVNDINILVLK